MASISEFYSKSLAAEVSKGIDQNPNNGGRPGKAPVGHMNVQGTICCNGNCYRPATPKALFDLGPLGRWALAEEVVDSDRRFDERARHKLGRVGGPDAEGYARRMCPAAMGKLRCAL